MWLLEREFSCTYLWRPPQQSVCNLAHLRPIAGQWPFRLSCVEGVIGHLLIRDGRRRLVVSYDSFQTFSINYKVCWLNRSWRRSLKRLVRYETEKLVCAWSHHAFSFPEGLSGTLTYHWSAGPAHTVSVVSESLSWGNKQLLIGDKKQWEYGASH